MQKWYKSLVYIFFTTLLSTVNFYSQNLLTNGDFESGGNRNGFFINQYGLINPVNGSSTPGKYSITSDPKFMDFNFISGGDKTTGSGNMLVINGATSNNVVFWTAGNNGGTFPGLTVGTTYTLSFWIKSVSNEVTSSATQATINAFIVNASYTPSNIQAPLPALGWQKVSFAFIATQTFALIQLRTTSTSTIGNDFAVDDFELKAGGLPLKLDSNSSTNPTCTSINDGTITATASGGSTPYNYALIGTSSANNSTGKFTGLSEGTYTLTITDFAGASLPPITGIVLAAPNPLIVSATLPTVCPGTPTTLSVSGASGYTWTASPTDPSLTTPNSTNITVSPTQTTIYTASTGITTSATNLILNGDFEFGNVDFTSDYDFVISLPNTGQKKAYNIVKNPKLWFNLFSTCPDKTSGLGRMFVADGSTNSNDKVWVQNGVFVEQDTDYDFSYYLQNVVNDIPAKIEIYINGVSLGAPVAGSSTACNWVKQTYKWNSGSNTFASIVIYNREISGGGNDFAIDDISLVESPICPLSKSITITVNSTLTLEIKNPAPVCSGGIVDITLPAITLGSTTGTTLTYWTNAAATTALANPKAITASGTYYIKSTLGSCSIVKPVVVTISTPPFLSITNPPGVCSPATVDITLPSVTAGSTGGVITYWTNAAATTVLTTPRAIATSGTYYIKSTAGICSIIKPVTVIVTATPVLSITNPSEVCSPVPVNITSAAVTAGSTGGVLSYWTNAFATTVLTSPSAITTSGTYYIKSTSGICSDIKPVVVSISTPPILSITNPPVVCSPVTVDITLPSVTAGSTVGGTITYWTNPAATTVLTTPRAITTSGTYYIKSTSGKCFDIKPVTVTVTTTPFLSIINPVAVCSPATVDITFPPITTGSTPGTLSYWVDDRATKPLPNPYTISVAGTYYIKNTVNSCFRIKPVTVTIINSGSIVAPTVSTPVIYCQNSVASSLTATPASAGATLNWYGTNVAGGTATSTAPIPSTSTVGQSIYYVSQTIGTCESPRVGIVVTISAPPSAGTLSGTQNVCVGLTTVFTSSVAGGVWRSIDTSIATVNSVNGDIRGISTGITEINYLVEGTDVCDSVSATRTVTVAGPPVAGTLNGNQNVCVGLTTVFTSTVSGGTWSSSNNAIATVNSATGLVTGISGGAAIITYTAVGTGSCDRFTATRTITVKPNTLTSESSNATLCVNSILTNITHTTSGASGIGIPTGLPAGVSASFTNNTITIKGTPIVAGTFKYSIPLIGCGTSNATGLINVTTLGNLSLTSPSTTPIGFFDTVTLNVQLSEATDLYGLYMKVKGNAAVSQYLDYQGFTASTLLGSGSNVISTPPTVTNGVFDFGITKVGPSSGYSGSGLYYTLSFTPKNISIPDGTVFCFSIDNISAYNSSGISCSLTNQGEYCYTFTNKVNVWPGDLNKSKTVTTADILPIGYFYNSTGPARPNATIQWTAQPIIPWGYNRSTQNGDAYKVFADSNGDGVITNADQAAIGFNMTKVHSKSANIKPFAISPKVEQTTLAGGALVVTSNTNVINTTNLPQTVTFTVNLNNTGGLDALYGISVNLIFDDTIFDLSTASIDYTGTIFGKTGSDCLILNYNSATGVSVGLTRYANAAINGQGLLFKVTLSTKLPVVSSLSETQVTAYADTANNQAGDILVVQDAPVTTIVIKNNLSVDNNIADEFVLYPNPVNDILYLSTGKSTDQLENLKLIVFNTLGQIVNEIPIKNSNMKISTRNWGASGVYFVKIVDDANYIMSVRKIILR